MYSSFLISQIITRPKQMSKDRSKVLLHLFEVEVKKAYKQLKNEKKLTPTRELVYVFSTIWI